MKKFALIVFLTLYIMFGLFPSFPINGKIKSIKIEKSTPNKSWACLVIKDRSEIEKLIKPIKLIWRNILPLNSWDGFPMYWLTIYYEDGDIDKYFFNKNEWSNGAKTPKEFFKLVTQYSITKSCT